MNAEPFDPSTPSAPEAAQEETTSTPPTPARRSRSRRATSSTAQSTSSVSRDDAAQEDPISAPAPSRRSRQSTARAARSSLDKADAATPVATMVDETSSPARSNRRRGRGSRQSAQEEQAVLDADRSTVDLALVEPTSLENDRELDVFALPPLPTHVVGDGDEDDEADLDDAIASAVDGAPDDKDFNTALPAALDAASDDAVEETASTTGTRRRRRRNRGGRAAVAENEPASADVASLDDEPAPALAASSALDRTGESVVESSALLRRFDRGDWRSRMPGATSRPSRSDIFAARMAAASPRVAAGDPAVRAAPAEPVVRPTADTRPAANIAPTTPAVSTAPAARFSRQGVSPAQSGDGEAEKTTEDRPNRFNERSRGRDQDRDRERPAALTFENTTPSTDAPVDARAEQAVSPSSPVVAPTSAPTVFTPAPTSPIVTPYNAPPASTGAPSSSTVAARGGEVLDERLERLLTNQSLMLAQQQQVLASLTNTIGALQDTLSRLTTSGITANAPRTGVFVDAPNVIYAAENARVNLDYGKMLDFLGRGREIVHALVYAPVTEDPGSRPENQRFVAPFLRRGYKIVTKPLKRFPDGTAKGNFDIELAIDIMTMSERLDIVVLLSGDSDFARLVQLVQSRGVRVEVASFASNVSWELVQMADVFMDLGQYVREFQET